MFRRTLLSRGHQLLKEPLPNTEHSTLARGKQVHSMTMSRMNQRYALAASGLGAALFSVFFCGEFHEATISSNGAIRRNNA